MHNSTFPSPTRRPFLIALLGSALMPVPSAQAQSASPAPSMALSFRNKTYLHRWSNAGQHEFTPADQPDLKQWRDMLSINVHASVRSDEALADVANAVLGNYQRHGKVLQTRSTPRRAGQAAEHFMAAVLGRPDSLEAAFARCVLVENTGLVLVASHRIHGKAVGPAMSEWLAAQGTAAEDALLAWSQWPSMANLQRLPQSRG